MKQLREVLTLTDAEIIGLHRTPVKVGSTYVIKVEAPFTFEIAEVLGCQNQTFNLDRKPYLNTVKLENHDISACEFSVPRVPKIQPTVVTGFSIAPSEKADEEGELKISFRIKFVGAEPKIGRILNDVFDEYAAKTIDFSIIALQENLYDAAKPKGDGPAGGKRVPMSDGQLTLEEQAANANPQDEPPAPVAAAVMEGQPVESALSEAEEEGSTLARAGAVEGSHRRAGKKERRTHDESVVPEPGNAPAIH